MLLITSRNLRRARNAAGSNRYCAKLGPLAVAIAIVSVATALSVVEASARVCRPKLAIASAAFSDMQAPFRERRWTAIIAADATQCSTTAGYFELGILREKENAFDLEFRKQFIWSGSRTLVSVDFWADEAVGSAWIESIQACPCLSEDIAKSDAAPK